MKPETRGGLLIGLIFIVGFGWILSEFRGPQEQVQPNPVLSEPIVNMTYYQQDEPKLKEVAFGQVPPPQGRPRFVSPRRRTGTATMDVVKPRPSGPTDGMVLATMRRQAPADDAVTPTLAEAPIANRTTIVDSPPAGRTYTVQSSDTLTRIARKMYGSDKGHLYSRIYQANRDRLSDPSSVRTGQVLVIPPLAEKPERRTVASTPRVRVMDMEQLARHVGAPQPQKPRRVRVYVVQDGDNLTRIARKVFNDTSDETIDSIYEANKDRMTDRNTIRKGMKLRMPG
jgi:nucleoid-associated protein YgaU